MKTALKRSTALVAAVAAVIPAIAGCSNSAQRPYPMTADRKEKTIAAIQKSNLPPDVKAAEIRNVKNAP